MKKYIAYIDESGDPHFNEHASDIFFMGATLIKKENRQEITKALESIKKRHDLRELKSSRISENRRLRICNQLIHLDIQLFTIWVMKKKLVGDWFRYKKSFYKYIHKRLNREIYRHFGSVHVIPDKYGSLQYQQSLQKYLIDSLQTELFNPSMEIGTAKKNSFIQVSDFLSGTIRKALKGDFENNDTFLTLLKPIWKVKIALPDDGVYVDPDALEDSDKYFWICLEEAKRYLEINSTKQNDPKIKTLEYLYYTALQNPNEYVYTAEILNWLVDLNLRLSEEQFRNEVTASLRDDGLIIVGTRKGLKIPTRYDDFIEYISFSTNIALPILKRLKKAINFVSIKADRKDLFQILSPEMQNILSEVNS